MDPIHASSMQGAMSGRSRIVRDTGEWIGKCRWLQVTVPYRIDRRGIPVGTNVDRLALENVADVTDYTRPAWDWEALSPGSIRGS